MASTDRLKRLLDISGSQVLGRSVTAVLFVSDNGDNTDGASWDQAYTTLPAALDAASTDVNECTLIVVGINTGANYYDINLTGDPTWTGNYVIMGTHRTWQKIKNDHATATSIMKFTGYVSLINLNFNLGLDNNGVIITKGAFRVKNCQFVGEDLTSPATALHLDGATSLKHGIISGCGFKGEGTTQMTGILIDNTSYSNFSDLRLHHCNTAIQIVGASSPDQNEFYDLDIGNNGVGLDIDTGSEQHLTDINFHNNTTNIVDAVGDHSWSNIRGEFDIVTLPDDFTGIAVPTGDGADTWSGLVTVYSNGGDSPYRIVGAALEPGTSEWYRIQLTADNGATYFDDLMFDANKLQGSVAPSGTEHIFNKGTIIKARSKSKSAGIDTLGVWLNIQEI
ncbi:MAG: hypothetical protein ACTSVR_04690 [Candidatus Thorarchaeota archaeon]